MSEPLPKFCIRCEDPLDSLASRFFRGITEGGVVKNVIEYFCEPCFAIWNPILARKIKS